MKILLVDDSRTVLSRYARLLGEEGYEVHTASSADEGLAIARREHPDLAIVDFHMQDATGDALVGALFHDPRTEGITVVMLSADEHAVHAALSAGAIDLIQKEERAPTFLKRVAAICRTIKVQRARYEGLRAVLECATDALGVGVLVVDGEDARALNTRMEALAEKYGGVAPFAAAARATCALPIDSSRLELRTLDLEDGRRVVLVRENP